MSCACLAAATRAREEDLAHRVEPADPSGRDASRIEVGLDRKTGDERDAVPGHDSAPHRFLQTELEVEVEVAQPHPGLPQLVLDHLTDSRTLLHDDQLLALQVVERDRLAGEAMIRGTGEHDLVAEER